MRFASDNAGPVHPKILEAVVAANDGYQMPYGAEAMMEAVRGRLRDLCGLPDAAVALVATGTAANALALAVLCKPWQTVFCSSVAHIAEDECGAPEFYTGGAKLTLVEAPGGLMDPGALRDVIGRTGGAVHGVQRGPVSLTTVSERGTVYDAARQAALEAAARDHGLALHLDGARLANAVAARRVPTADLTRGMDAVSFGATKNGAMGVEAVLLRDPSLGWEFELRRKRAGHLVSKHRYLSAQMAAYLADDLWLETAARANAAAERLRAGLRRIPGVILADETHANIVFAVAPRSAHARLRAAGAAFYTRGAAMGDPEEPLPMRLVCDWSARDAETDRFLEILAA